ncbi:MAG: hypothetical protein CMM47_10620 [Rhodospirillaceae bacterium]|nr:hypothetical protein [Rhodospirillaceae bacterium]
MASATSHLENFFQARGRLFLYIPQGVIVELEKQDFGNEQIAFHVDARYMFDGRVCGKLMVSLIDNA